MTTVASSLSPARRRLARATAVDRILLIVAHRLEDLAVAHMERRATASRLESARAAEDADERRRTAAALVYTGMLPR